MNIRDILVQDSKPAVRNGSISAESSFLGIGKKGQEVEGTVTEVSGQVSIDFNGVPVRVSTSAVQNAREGETRKFRIMDVSKESIVLKEVGRMQESADPHSMINTSVNGGSYSFAECMEQAAQSSQVKQDAGQNLAILTGEDYKKLEEEEGALEKYQESSLDRAIERIRAERQWTQERQEEGIQLRQELQEGLEKIQATGFLTEKCEGQIRSALEQSNLPVTQECISQVVSALQMSQVSAELSDSSKAYLIRQELAPTIENIYHSQYSGNDGVPADSVDQEVWKEYLPQIRKILEGMGDGDYSNMEAAKWLFANELPVNENTVSMVNILEVIKQNMTPEKVLGQVLQSMSAGGAAAQATLDDTQFVMAKELLEQIAGIEDRDIVTALQMAADYNAENYGAAVSRGESGSQTEQQLTIQMLIEAGKYNQQNKVSEVQIPAVVAEGMTEEEIQAVTAKRQLEEIRLSMTLQSAMSFARKGIYIETEPLEEVIKQLRQLEDAYYMQQVQAEGGTVSQEELNLMRETMQKTSDIAAAPAALLGSSVKQYHLITVNELHAAAVSATRQYQQYQQDYEAVGTQVRTDLGDSIKKAFAGIPELLAELGLEDTEVNLRAVRILGYNQMEITSENINSVKQFDTEVNRLIDQMKPSVVLDLIRDGNNPLDTSVDQLNQELAEKIQEKDSVEDEKYSKYLWKLERNGEITEEERSGYIGMYRLLHQIERTDGAVIGAVIQAGQNMTLGNLLTAARTLRGRGMDTRVDENFGMGEISFNSETITQQLENGFSGDSQRYYETLLSETMRELDPAKLHEISDGEMTRLLGTSLERLSEEMKAASGDPQLEQEYYEMQAQQIRETAERAADAKEYLLKLQIPDTMENIRAAEAVLEEGGTIIKEFFDRKKVLKEEEQKEFEEILEEMPEHLTDRETMLKQCEKAESFMEKILVESRKSADITSEDLQRLKLLGQSLHLSKAMTGKQCYDIPIQTGDTVTNMNLTLIQGMGETGRIQISMDDKTLGTISMDMKIQKEQVKGLILCDSRVGYETFKDHGEILEGSLESAGYFISNISYGMDFKSRSEMLKEMPEEARTDTSDLYRAAKVMVRFATALIQQKAEE